LSWFNTNVIIFVPVPGGAGVAVGVPVVVGSAQIEF
jgi:hypothetical protein